MRVDPTLRDNGIALIGLRPKCFLKLCLKPILWDPFVCCCCYLLTPQSIQNLVGRWLERALESNGIKRPTTPTLHKTTPTRTRVERCDARDDERPSGLKEKTTLCCNKLFYLSILSPILPFSCLVQFFLSLYIPFFIQLAFCSRSFRSRYLDVLV